MRQTMKKFEKWCLEYAERWNKKELWDSFILVKDAWLNGYYKGRDEAISIVFNQWGVSHWDKDEPDTYNLLIEKLRNEEVEVELQSNQIGSDLPPLTSEQFKKEMLKVYGCEDLRVDVKNGVFSFQGVFKGHEK